MSAVIVLNTDNTALHTVSIKHAILMLVREVAIVEEARDGHRIGPYPWPLVLRLIRYVKTTFLYARTPAWSIIGAPTARAPQILLITCCRSPGEAPIAGRTPWQHALGVTTARPTGPQLRPG